MPDSLYALGKEIGELIGAVRQNNHNLNNLSMKVDALAHVATIQESMLEQSRLLVEELREIKHKVENLETKENRREGATGVVGFLIRTPMLGWMAAFAAWIWAYVNGWISK
jgi:hypothetical protein